MSLIPVDGSAKGNMTLRTEFLEESSKKHGVQLNEDDYWNLRDALVDDGKIGLGRGKGGSVRRLSESPEVELQVATDQDVAQQPYKVESDLYEPFHETIRHYYVKDYRLKDYVSEITAHGGGKYTGGKWTRPDLTLVAVKMFQYIPGKTLEVITFELKRAEWWGVEGVYETAAHSSFAHSSYLCIHAPTVIPSSDQDRLEREAQRFGVGLILFENPKDWDTFDVRVDPEYKFPDPEETNRFISIQLSEPNKERIAYLIR